MILPSVQVLTSENLRDHVFNVDRCKDMYSFICCKFKSYVDQCKKMFSFFYRKFKCNKNDVGGPGEDTELHSDIG